jgi:hypothetical protein
LVVGGVLGEPIVWKLPPPHLGWVASLSLAGDVRWIQSWGRGHPQDVEDVAVSSWGAVTTVGGVRTADHSFALTVRTYSRAGDAMTRQIIDPADRSLVGYGVSISVGGTTLAGTVFEHAYVHETTGVGGRLWRA